MIIGKDYDSRIVSEICKWFIETSCKCCS